MPDDSNAAQKPRWTRPKNPAAMNLAKAHTLADLQRLARQEHERQQYSRNYLRLDLIDEAIGIKKRQIAYRKGERDRTKLQKLPFPEIPDGDKPPPVPFGMIPVDMFPRLRKSSIHVYAALAGDFAMRGNNLTWVTIEQLTEATKLSRRMVFKAIRQLEDDYWIETIRNGRANRYRALPWPEVQLRQSFAERREHLDRNNIYVLRGALQCTSEVHSSAPNKEEETKTSRSASAEKGRRIHAALFGNTPPGREVGEDGVASLSKHIGEFLGRGN